MLTHALVWGRMALSGAGILWSGAAGPWYWPGIGRALDDSGTLAFLTLLAFLNILFPF